MTTLHDITRRNFKGRVFELTQENARQLQMDVEYLIDVVEELHKCVEDLSNELRAAIIRCRKEGVSSPALEFVCSKMEIDAKETLKRIGKVE